LPTCSHARPHTVLYKFVLWSTTSSPQYNLNPIASSVDRKITWKHSPMSDHVISTESGSMPEVSSEPRKSDSRSWGNLTPTCLSNRLVHFIGRRLLKSGSHPARSQANTSPAARFSWLGHRTTMARCGGVGKRKTARGIRARGRPHKHLGMPRGFTRGKVKAPGRRHPRTCHPALRAGAGGDRSLLPDWIVPAGLIGTATHRPAGGGN